MALSPWKRLTQLMLRRRPADQVQALVSDDREARDAVIDTTDAAFANPKVDGGDPSELEHIAALADELLQPSKAEQAEEVETAAVSEAAREPLREDKSPAADEVPPAEPSVQPHDDQADKASRSRRNTAKAAPPVQVEQEHVRAPDTARSSSPDPRALNAEIRHLRAQLSAKLRIQGLCGHFYINTR